MIVIMKIKQNKSKGGGDGFIPCHRKYSTWVFDQAEHTLN